MAVDAVFQHVDGYKFNQIYKSAKKFINSLNRQRNAEFLHAVDYDKQLIIKPSNIQDYKRQIYQ